MSLRPARMALLDSSGADFEFIGIVIGHARDLKEIANKLSKRPLHMRKLSRERRRRIARAFLNITHRYDIVIISIRTRLSRVVNEMRTKNPFMPSIKVRAMCFRALTNILISLIYQYQVGAIMADREFEIMRDLSGKRLLVREVNTSLLWLADIVAWLNGQIAKRRWILSGEERSSIKKLDIEDKLRSLLGLMG